MNSLLKKIAYNPKLKIFKELNSFVGIRGLCPYRGYVKILRIDNEYITDDLGYSVWAIEEYYWVEGIRGSFINFWFNISSITSDYIEFNSGSLGRNQEYRSRYSEEDRQKCRLYLL